MKKKLELNLNIPLLSVRRRRLILPSNYQHTAAAATTTTTCCSVIDDETILDSEGVPFSWEQAPGKPKPIGHMKVVVSSSVSLSSSDDIDELGVEEEVASLSEAIDILELQRAERHDKMQVVVVDDDHMELQKQLLQQEEEDEGRRRPISPSFIINRFLPDANALAQEYSFNCYHQQYHMSSSSSVVAAPIKQGCGLDNIFSWRTITKRTTR